MIVPQLDFQFFPMNIMGSIFLFLSFFLIFKIILYDIYLKIKIKNNKIIKGTDYLEKIIIEDRKIDNDISHLKSEKNNIINENTYIANENPNIILKNYQDEALKKNHKELQKISLKYKNDENIQWFIDENKE